MTIGPRVKYSGPFFLFTSGFLRSLEEGRLAETGQALGASVQEVLRVWKRDPDLHLLVTHHAQTKDIVEFVRRYDQIRADLGFLKLK